MSGVVSAIHPSNLAPQISLLMPDGNSVDQDAITQSGFASTLKGYMQALDVDSGADEVDSTKQHDRVPSVGDGIKSFFSDVNGKILDSDRQTRDLMSGKTTDSGAVASAVEEADLSMDMLLAVTKRVTAAYQSIQSITI